MTFLGCWTFKPSETLDECDIPLSGTYRGSFFEKIITNLKNLQVLHIMLQKQTQLLILQMENTLAILFAVIVKLLVITHTVNIAIPVQ